jgi:hypothetical protein
MQDRITATHNGPRTTVRAQNSKLLPHGAPPPPVARAALNTPADYITDPIKAESLDIIPYNDITDVAYPH